jgi:hypothetical protein
MTPILDLRGKNQGLSQSHNMGDNRKVLRESRIILVVVRLQVDYALYLVLTRTNTSRTCEAGMLEPD